MTKSNRADNDFVEAGYWPAMFILSNSKNLQAKAFNAIRIEPELFTPAHYIVARLAWEARIIETD